MPDVPPCPPPARWLPAIGSAQRTGTAARYNSAMPAAGGGSHGAGEAAAMPPLLLLLVLPRQPPPRRL